MSRKETRHKRLEKLEQAARICICQPPIIAFYSNDAEMRADEKLPKQKCTIPGHTGPSYTAIGIFLGPCDCGACPACLGTPMTASPRDHMARDQALPAGVHCSQAAYRAPQRRQKKKCFGNRGRSTRWYHNQQSRHRGVRQRPRSDSGSCSSSATGRGSIRPR